MYKRQLEGVERKFSFIDAASTPEPLEDKLPASPAPAYEEHPSGSRYEEDNSDKKGVRGTTARTMI